MDESARTRVFLNSINRVEKELQRALGDSDAKLKVATRKYAQSHPQWADEHELLALADIRNILAHNDGIPHRMAIPTPEAVNAIKAIEKRLFSPELAGQRFRRSVRRIGPGTPILSILKLVHALDYSQFPVVEGGKVVGLLTENGLARWLAKHATDATTQLDLKRTNASTILKSQESSKAYGFVSGQCTVDEVVCMFSNAPILEAVIVTQSGAPALPLVGIATRWDILELKK
jgi:predicted transcriptional regulator